MKRIFTILAAVTLTAIVSAQAPERMSYQAVIRDDGGNLVTDQAVGMQISILQGDIYGASVYVETQNPTTNANGLVSFEIGGGTVITGDFAAIDWANGPYFIKTETDPTGGTSYTITGTSELLSVPYALHAKSAETVENVVISGTEPAFDGWDKNATDDFDGAFGSLTGIPADLADGDDDTQLNEGQVEAYIDGDETSFDGWDKNAADDFSGDYNDLSNRPNLSNMISISSPQEGDMIYYTSGNWVRLPRGSNGESLYLEGGLPTWREYGETNIQGYFQFVTYKPGSSSPIAFGFINSDGSIASGTGNFTCSWNGTIGRYEISITGESYFYNDYATVVSTSTNAAADGAIIRTGSVSGMLLIYIQR